MFGLTDFIEIPNLEIKNVADFLGIAPKAQLLGLGLILSVFAQYIPKFIGWLLYGTKLMFSGHYSSWFRSKA